MYKVLKIHEVIYFSLIEEVIKWIWKHKSFNTIKSEVIVQVTSNWIQMDLRGRSLRCSKVSFFLFVFFSESLNCRVSKCVDPCVEMKWSSVLVGLHCWELASLQTLSAKLPITVAFSTVWVLGDSQLGSGHQFSLSKCVFTSCLRSDLTTQLCLVLYILFIFYYILDI